jgi:hypothetical protein
MCFTRYRTSCRPALRRGRTTFYSPDNIANFNLRNVITRPDDKFGPPRARLRPMVLEQLHIATFRLWEVPH